ARGVFDPAFCRLGDRRRAGLCRGIAAAGLGCRRRPWPRRGLPRAADRRLSDPEHVAVWFGTLAQGSGTPSETRAFHSVAGAASRRRARPRQQWHLRHRLAARSCWRGADVRAAVGGCAGATADPAWLSVAADRGRGSTLHKPLKRRARGTTTV